MLVRKRVILFKSIIFFKYIKNALFFTKKERDLVSSEILINMDGVKEFGQKIKMPKGKYSEHDVEL